MDPLLQGFTCYHDTYFGNTQLYESLNEGQHPSILVIGCCDSRVHPPALFGSEPGEMFVLRNVANLVPPHDTDNQHASVAAALEFAVLSLHVKRIIVLGHKNCGGIRALMDDSAPANSFLAKWLELAQTAKLAAKSLHGRHKWRNPYEVCEQVAILVSLSNLLSYPWLAERVAAQTLQLDGWYFDMQAGALLGYDSEQQDFVRLAP